MIRPLDLAPPSARFVAMTTCPCCGKLKPRAEVEHEDGACLSCVTGAGRPAEEPATAVLRARRQHRPAVEADSPVRQRRAVGVL